MRSTRFLLAPAFALLLGLATGCSDDGNGDADGSASGGGSDTLPAEDGGATGEVSGDTEAVDVCALFTEADFEAVFGTAPLSPGEPQAATGSFLGGCDYVAADGTTASVSARPANEYDTTIAVYEAVPVAGVSFDAAFEESTGMFARFDGVPWFLHILATGSDGPGTWDQERSAAIASAISAHL